MVVSAIPTNVKVAAGEKKILTFLFSARTNIPGDKRGPEETPHAAALREFEAAKALQNSQPAHQGQTPLMEAHLEEWEKEIWGKGDIVIEGNSELSQIVYSSLYWILMSVRADWPWSLSPGSLASNSYNGHSFWDTETWMYPPLLLLYPDIAESLLQYRFNHLEAAKAKAKAYNHCGPNTKLLFDCIVWPPDRDMWMSWNTGQQQQMLRIMEIVKNEYIHPSDMPTVPFTNAFNAPSENQTVPEDFQGNCNYRGAMFAWETGFTGAEVCPCVAGGTCLHEHHVSGDVAFAAYQYWQLTHNLDWLEKEGFLLAYEIAVFFESRGK